MSDTEKKPLKKRKRKIIPAICNILGTLLILVVILFGASMTIPRLMGYQVYDIISGSMEPEIPVGSVIYVKPIEPVDVQKNDVIAFNQNGEVVCHRVVQNQIVEGRFVTKGDANEEEDINKADYSDLIGVVTRHYPALGTYMNIFSTSIGKVYVIEILVCGVLCRILGQKTGSNETSVKIANQYFPDSDGAVIQVKQQLIPYQRRIYSPNASLTNSLTWK